MTTPSLTHIDNTQDEIHSHDVIARIVELERLKAAAEAEGEPFDGEEASELADLVDLELQCTDRARGAWRDGTSLIHPNHFTEWLTPMRRRNTTTYVERVEFAGVWYHLQTS